MRDTSTSESNDPSVNPRTCHSRRLVSALESPNLCPTHHSWMKGSTKPILRRIVTNTGICTGLICRTPLVFNAIMLLCFGSIYRPRWFRRPPKSNLLGRGLACLLPESLIVPAKGAVPSSDLRDPNHWGTTPVYLRICRHRRVRHRPAARSTTSARHRDHRKSAWSMKN